MRKVRLNLTGLRLRVSSRHKEIEIGEKYFLSHFHDKEGATVRVISKSVKENRAGWNSSVSVRILQSDCDYYKPGALYTVNATNLYNDRYFASPEYKFRPK